MCQTRSIALLLSQYTTLISVPSSKALLKSIGLSDELIEWFSDYLSNIRQSLFLLDLELNFIDKLLVFRWELIVLLLLQICFFFVMRDIS